MCSAVEFYNEATDEWEELGTVRELRRRFDVLPDDTDPEDYEDDDICLCGTDVEAIVKRSGLTFVESLCPGDFIVGPKDLIHTQKRGPATHQWTTTHADPIRKPTPSSPSGITLEDHLAYVDSVDASLARAEVSTPKDATNG